MPKDIKTMEDFSEFAGLSRPTVSKYFNDPSSVRKSTRKIVEAAILRSGYKPNLFASNRRTHILGVIVPEFQRSILYVADTSHTGFGGFGRLYGFHAKLRRTTGA